ncbi:OmpA family protein [Vibrio lentus]|uniref:OmpA family protein n=1 Tax=Vibrio lentus TaxID=136468 RepID=UPI00178CA3DF|nr:OmpA family protein [Vibrio lentus]MDN3628128.1 outer membrane beta-barrel protein [Vibrio lentus]
MKLNYLFICTALISSATAYAQPNQSDVFVGLQSGYNFADEVKDVDDMEDNWLLGIYGGYQWNNNWSIDLGYQHWSTLEANNKATDIDTSIIQSGIRYDWMFAEKWSLFGKIGAAYWDLKNKDNSSGIEQTETGLSPLGEVGLAYDISKHWQVNTSYQYVHEVGNNSPSIGLFNNHSALLGLKYRFGLGKETSNEVIESQRPSQLIEPTVVESKLKEESEEFENTNKVPLVLPTSVGIDSFAVSSYELSKVQASKVDKIIQLMKQRQELQVIIVGHSDNEGSETLNKQLAGKRASSVAQYLENAEISRDRMNVFSDGETNPIADNNTNAGRAKNRRVNIGFSYN